MAKQNESERRRGRERGERVSADTGLWSIPKFEERFARQYSYEPPPEFPLASPCSVTDPLMLLSLGIVLSKIFGFECCVVLAVSTPCSPFVFRVVKAQICSG